MEEPTRASLETFFRPGARDVMLSLCGLQSAYVFHFSIILRAFKLMRFLAIHNKKAENCCVVQTLLQSMAVSSVLAIFIYLVAYLSSYHEKAINALHELA